MERVVTVEPEAGLHARPAAKFVETANQFDSQITVAPVDDGASADAGSMLAVTGLGIEHGERVRLEADGPDADAALDALEDLLSQPAP